MVGGSLVGLVFCIFGKGRGGTDGRVAMDSEEREICSR